MGWLASTKEKLARARSVGPQDVVGSLQRSQQLSARKSSSHAKWPVICEMDDRRVYLPTQKVQANIRFEKPLRELADEVVVEIRGMVHSHAWISTGQSAALEEERDVFWLASAVVLNSGAAGPATSREGGLSFTQNGEEAWQVEAVVPSRVTFATHKKPKHHTSAKVPPSFKDNTRDPSASDYVVYSVKVVGQRRSAKRNLRYWKPFVVLPLSDGPPSAAIFSPPCLPYSARPTPTTAQQMLSAAVPEVGLPDTWMSMASTSSIKQAMLIKKAHVTATAFLPALDNVPASASVPVWIHIAVSAKNGEALQDGSIPLPLLPLGGDVSKGKDAVTDAQESARPTFTIERTVLSSAQGASEKHTSRFTPDLQWDQPAPYATDSEGQNDNALPFSGYGWSDVQPTSEAQLRPDQSEPLPYSRSAMLSGRISADLPPPILSLNLTVDYRLSFKWSVSGAGNSIDLDLGPWIGSSGVSSQELQGLGERKLNGLMRPEEEARWHALDERAGGSRMKDLFSGEAELPGYDGEDGSEGHDDNRSRRKSGKGKGGDWDDDSD